MGAPTDTLADVRNNDPAKFDAIIRDSVHEAARNVGRDTVIAALCNPTRIQEHAKAA